MGFLDKLFTSGNDKQLKKLSATADKVLALSSGYAKKTDDELRAYTAIFKERLAKGETLDDILVEAYAVVSEAVKRVLGFTLYKVQIMGGIALHQGRIAEMLTGEGKTVVETLPAYLNALLGKGVHIVTVNEYLADRDAGWMGGVYRFLGLTVGLIKSFQPHEEKKAAYMCDITYGTNNEFGFDYLRDNMQDSMSKVCQRDLYFAIVDEVDSVLIDEAKTPLIIAGQSITPVELYVKADAFAKSLIASTNASAEKERYNYEEGDGDFTIDEELDTISLTTRGAEKANQYFGVENISDEIELYKHIRFAVKANYLMKKDKNYVVIDGEVLIVDEFTGRLMVGRRYSEGLHQAIEAKEGVAIQGESKTYASVTFQNYFRLYDKLSGMTGTAKIEEQEFLEIYGVDVVCIPPNKEVVRVDEDDRVYPSYVAKLEAIVADIAEAHSKGQPVLVGTPTVEKSEELSKILHEKGVQHLLLNAKNHREEALIIAQAGRKGSVTVATNMAGRGTDIILGGNAGFYAVKSLENDGYEPELIDKALHTARNELTPKMEEICRKYDEKRMGIANELQREREEVVALGGLRVIGTEKNENRRIDNQFRGRSGRQGDVGSSVYYLSFEDDLLRIPFKKELDKYVEENNLEADSLLQNKFVYGKIKNAQTDLEQKNYSIRKNVLSYDDVLNKQRISIYGERRRLMREGSVHDKIVGYFTDYVSEIVQNEVDFRDDYRYWDYEDLNSRLNEQLYLDGEQVVTIGLAAEMSIDRIIDEVLRATIEHYNAKMKSIDDNGGESSELENVLMLRVIDHEWIEQMDNMENLRSCVGLKALGQVNPVTAYQIEGMKFFDEMIETIKHKTVEKVLSLKLELADINDNVQELQSYPDELLEDGE